MTRKEECCKNTFHHLLMEVLMTTKIHRENGLRTKDQLLRLILVTLRAMLIQRILVHSLKEWFRLLIRRNPRSSLIWLRIPRLSFHYCHGKRGWRRRSSWLLTSQLLKLYALPAMDVHLESTFQTMMISEKKKVSRMCTQEMLCQQSRFQVSNSLQKNKLKSQPTILAQYTNFMQDVMNFQDTVQEDLSTETKKERHLNLLTQSQRKNTKAATRRVMFGTPDLEKFHQATKNAELTLLVSSSAHSRMYILSLALMMKM